MTGWELLLTEANPIVLAALMATYYRLKKRLDRLERQFDRLNPVGDADTAAD